MPDFSAAAPATPEPTSGERTCFEQTSCWLLKCSCCGVLAFDDDTSEWAGVVHFESPEQAAATAQEEDNGWVVAGGVAYCRRCLEQFGCYTAGHDWMPWRDHCSERYVGRVRHCDRCGQSEWDPPLTIPPDPWEARS